MLISNNINCYNQYNLNNYPLEQRFVNVGLDRDTVSFTGKKNKSIENSMKKISGLHDPYSDIIMISEPEYEKYMNKVEKRPTANSMLNLLNGYKDNLFAPELVVCEMLSDEIKYLKSINPTKANSIDLHELLNEYYSGAKFSLTRNQFGVLENIKRIISESNGRTKEQLEAIFEPVSETIANDSFRINPLLCKVRSTKGIDRVIKKRILNEMDNFPNSRNSADVFIITNAHKTHEEIAEAFITPSRVSIEHIRPQSRSGASSAGNYLIASKRMNSLRSSMLLSTFIKRNPQIPNCMDRYFNDLVKKINKGGLTAIAMSLPEVKEAIEKESNGLIDIEIEGISTKERSKIKDLKEQLNDLVQKFCK